MKRPVIKGPADNDAAPETNDGVQGFFDRQCRSCKRKYGWSGTINDVPPNCPKCGAALSDKEKADLLHDEQIMNEFRKQLLKDNDDSLPTGETTVQPT